MTKARLLITLAFSLPVFYGQTEFRGILVDGGCRNRTTFNLRQTPENRMGTPAQQPQNLAAKGITVSPKTSQNERGDILIHMVPDLIAGEADPTCGVTGGTRSFGVLLDDGRYFDLDDAGNAFAPEAVYATKSGRDMLNGRGAAVKPRVTIEGRVRGTRIMADSLRARE